MPFLELKDIGKIYVSEGNVSVGIRGVNLSFEKGEFVAVTGKSGSGKSTLLNVISGMDSYEEGELYIEDQPTSHYLQPEWEEYREKYISFIFQDYNIIESFTVLQNVELSLMHIEDKKERRARAIELLKRVGLSSHLNHKGSKLSGGQKQRTVIARALAKDSPIILADEPTGNLDSETSKEIIELLREVSRDKLLIVVTHNFEQLESVATRHIRIFDGSVESDHTFGSIDNIEIASDKKEEKNKSFSDKHVSELKKGALLGKTIFCAKPRLSVFLCFLMIIGTLGVFLITTFCGQAREAFEPNYMFNHIDGRVVLSNHDGTPFTDDELKEICEKYGAETYLHYDLLLDSSYNAHASIQESSLGYTRYLDFTYTFNEDFGDNIIGRYPQNANEIFLYLPIEFQQEFGKDKIEKEYIDFNNGYARMNVVGIKYFFDNNQDAKCLLTKEGFEILTASKIFVAHSQKESTVDVKIYEKAGIKGQDITVASIVTSFDIPDNKIYVASNAYHKFYQQYGASEKTSTVVYFNGKYISNRGQGTTISVARTFEDDNISHVYPPDVSDLAGQWGMINEDFVIFSDEILRDLLDETLRDFYPQASLFFKNDRVAEKKAELMQADGYVAIPSTSTLEFDGDDVISAVLTCVLLGCLWFFTIMFIAFFVNLCSGRALGAFKNDMAIMRSMGIGVKTIRIGMYFRMLLSLIPSFILMVIAATYIFTSPKLNPMFSYLYAWQYACIVIGMIILVFRTTKKQIRKLFGESVKKALKGGDVE